MIISAFMRLLSLLAKPIVLTTAFGLLLVLWISRGERLFEDTSFTRVAEQNRKKLIKADPKAGAILAKINDQRQQEALLVASYSAGENSHSRSILADMAKEAAAIDGLPYRARIAELALGKSDLRNSAARDAFLVSHSTACESLAIGGDWAATSDYVNLLEQAARLPNVWPLVCDDPLALVIWSKLEDPDLKLLSFYHSNRDWLADPLAALDLSGHDNGWKLQAVLKACEKHKTTLKAAVKQGELGVYALAVTLTHGSLIETCFERHELDPSEVVSVIIFNQDILGEREGDPRWVGEKAAWLAQMHQRHPIVWFAAARSPLAMRLHQDAPHVSDSLFDKYGAEEITALIYQHFSESRQVAAAASAIDRFGDLAIYVFARYDDPAFINHLGSYLVDDKIGIRVIPFVVRFGDDAFSRIRDDPNWVDRYFNPDGTSRADSLEWVEFVPGGAALQVARNWSNGYPCEWSELSWAAVDVADAALTVASFGTSKGVTEPAKAVAKGAKLAAKTERVASKGSRAAKAAGWRTALADSRVPAKAGARMSRVAEVAKALKTGALVLSKPIWGTVQLASEPLKLVSAGAYKSLAAWKAISPTKKMWIYRSLLAVGLYVTLTERTLPNLDKIGAGIGKNIGNAAAGTITLVGDALAEALQAFAEQVIGAGNDWVKRLIYWVVVGVLAVLIYLNVRHAIRDHQRVAIGG